MAQVTLLPESQARNAMEGVTGLVGELQGCANRALALEAILADVRAIVEAIDFGELLVALPADKNDARRHNSASMLLDLAKRRMAEEDALPGTDLSIKLSVIADRCATFSNREAA